MKRAPGGLLLLDFVIFEDVAYEFLVYTDNWAFINNKLRLLVLFIHFVKGRINPRVHDSLSLLFAIEILMTRYLENHQLQFWIVDSQVVVHFFFGWSVLDKILHIYIREMINNSFTSNQ